MSVHIHPEEFWNLALLPARIAQALYLPERRSGPRVVPVEAGALSRRAAHYAGLGAEDLNERFHGATGPGPVADWVARTRPDLLILADEEGAAPEGLAEIHRAGAGSTAGELALSVLPEARGQGLGRALVAAALEAAEAAGLETVEVNYCAGNRAMARLMRAAGAEIEVSGPDRVALLHLAPETVSPGTDTSV